MNRYVASRTTPSRTSKTERVEGKSLAAIFHGRAGLLDLTFVKTPMPGRGEMLVRIEGCVFGRNALDVFQQTDRSQRSVVLGNEMVGQVEIIGPETPRIDWCGQPLNVGSRIVWGSTTACGECYCCRHSLSQRCIRAARYGSFIGENSELLMGGFAEHCLIIPGTTVVSILRTLPLAAATQLSGPTATAAAVCESILSANTRSLLIIGAGLSGLTLAAMARIRGINKIIVCDDNPDRLKIATQFGATEVALPADLSSLVSKVTSCYGVDTAVDFSGESRVASQLMTNIRMGGTIAFLRTHPDIDYSPISLTRIASHHLSLIGIQGYQAKHLAIACEFMQQHHAAYPFAEAVSEWYPLAKAQDAAHAALNPRHFRIGITAGPA